MGAITGTMTFHRFLAKADGRFKEEWVDKIRQNRFYSVDPSNDCLESCGWTYFHSMLDTEFERHKVMENQYLRLKMRVEKIKVPSKLLKARVQEEIDLEKKARGMHQLPKGLKKDIVEKVALELAKQTSPSTDAYDMVWNLNSGVLFFFNQGKGTCQKFAELFTKTFDIRILPLHPIVYAVEKRPVLADLVTILSETNFVSPVEEEPGAKQLRNNLLNAEPKDVTVNYGRVLKYASFLGREFLTWLLYMSENDEAIDGHVVSFEDKLCLSSVGQVDNLNGYGTSESPEAIVALASGRVVTAAKIDCSDFVFFVKAESLEISGLKVPTRKKNIEEIFHERIEVAERAVYTFFKVFESFLNLRISDFWHLRVKSISTWIQYENVKDVA